ncbi:hypothetical protein [Leeia aquatica]|uniref:Uncharacterized protein n=1 Tax=Leeia aquatica TaxID=2725557 RepID=A0A847SHQ3_9NEIS|nr:hypothetical protein [Leeia aquatica]NLR76896.1 hypothetical protein [Leeia aquatica]
MQSKTWWIGLCAGVWLTGQALADNMPLAQWLKEGQATAVLYWLDQQPAVELTDPAWSTRETFRLQALLQQQQLPALQQHLTPGAPLLWPAANLWVAQQALKQGQLTAARQYLAPLLAAEHTLSPEMRAQASAALLESLLRDNQLDDALREAGRAGGLGLRLPEGLLRQLAVQALLQSQPDLAAVKALPLPADSLPAQVLAWRSGQANEAVLVAWLLKQLANPGMTWQAEELQLLHRVSADLNHARLQVEIGRVLLSQARLPTGVEASALLAQWARQGERIGNQAQLLTGDDDAWWALQTKLPAEQQWQAIPLLAYQNREASTPERRAQAAQALLAQLSNQPVAQWQLLPQLLPQGQAEWSAQLSAAQRQALAMQLGMGPQGREGGDALLAAKWWQGLADDLPAPAQLARQRDLLAIGARDEARKRLLAWAKPGATDEWLTALPLWTEKAKPGELAALWQALARNAGTEVGAQRELQRARSALGLGLWTEAAAHALAARQGSSGAARQEASLLARQALYRLGAVTEAQALEAAPAAETVAAANKPLSPAKPRKK